MSAPRQYAISETTGELIYRIPGMQHGDGQVDTDYTPVWLLADPNELSSADQAMLPIINDDADNEPS